MTSFLYRLVRKILLLTFCLLLQHFASRAQMLQGIDYVPQQEAPELKKIIETSSSTPEKVNALIRLGALYYHNPYPRTDNLKIAMQLAWEAGTISSKAGFKKANEDAQFLIANIYLRRFLPDSAATILTNVHDSTRIKILLGMSHIYRISENMDVNVRLKKAMDRTLQAKEISRRLHDTLLSVLVLREIVCINSDTQQPNSEKDLLDIIKLFRGIGYPYLHYTWYELTGLAKLEGSLDKEIYYSGLTLNSMTQTHDSLAAADWLLARAIVLRRNGQHEKSLEYCNQAIALFKKQFGDGNIAIAARYLTEELVKLKKQSALTNIIPKLYDHYPPVDINDSLYWFQTMGSFYRLNKEYEKGEPFYKMRIVIQQRIHIKPDYYGLGQLYVEGGKFVQAKYYLEKALLMIDSTASMGQKAHLQYCLFLADSATGNYLSAIRHLSQNKRYDDTLNKQSKIEAIEKYKAQFETEKKEAALNIKDQQIGVLTKDQQLKEMNLQKLRFVKNVSLYGSFILLAGFLLFFQLYRRKKRDSLTIDRINQQLKDMLAEKEWWLKEVHHRVKNNLHTIICLLESQAMYLENDALQAIEKSQHRIYAMSLIHQKLYQNEALRSIDMAVYLEEFVGYLKDSFDAQKIDFRLEVEPVHLNLKQAIPIALIINEGVTNAIKYAFETEITPIIWISITLNDGIVRLSIADNGKGFVLSEANETKSLGMQLIKGLTKELRGFVQIDAKNGTRLIIEFPKEPITDQIPATLREMV